MFYCTKCVMPSTRPRIQFDKNGVCNACSWNEQKKQIDWSKRWKELEFLCDQYRGRAPYDVLVPYSGGKNGAYIAYTLRTKLDMNPLCVTIRPPMPDSLGEQNILNFISKGFQHIYISPSSHTDRVLDKHEFINKGIPMHAFMISVQTAILRASVLLNIPFIMYAEEGESEYGGETKLLNTPFYTVEDGIDLYLSKTNPNDLVEKFNSLDTYWHTYPTQSELSELKPKLSHWSYFENFVNYEHYLIAKNKLGLLERSERNVGALENFSATDTNLIHLYFYLMYLKYGFGRTTSEVGNEIRRGAMTRNQAINLVSLYDGEFPSQYVNQYLDYYNMSEGEFFDTLRKWTNKKLFKIEGDSIIPTFRVS